MMQSDDLIEIIQVRENGEVRYYRKPESEQYQLYPSALIPKLLFDEYVDAKSDYVQFTRRIKLHFKTPKDKKMTVARYHVNEGETHKFGDDGSVSIRKDD
jgi:hypothetical protein